MNEDQIEIIQRPNAFSRFVEKIDSGMEFNGSDSHRFGKES